MVNLGARIKYLRTRDKLTQTQLAARIGVTKSMVSSYETSIRLPSLEVLIKLALLFKVTTDYLLGIDKQDNLNIPTLTESQRQAVFSMINAFQEG